MWDTRLRVERSRCGPGRSVGEVAGAARALRRVRVRVRVRVRARARVRVRVRVRRTSSNSVQRDRWCEVASCRRVACPRARCRGSLGRDDQRDEHEDRVLCWGPDTQPPSPRSPSLVCRRSRCPSCQGAPTRATWAHSSTACAGRGGQGGSIRSSTAHLQLRESAHPRCARRIGAHTFSASLCAVRI